KIGGRPPLILVISTPCFLILMFSTFLILKFRQQTNLCRHHRKRWGQAVRILLPCSGGVSRVLDAGVARPIGLPCGRALHNRKESYFMRRLLVVALLFLLPAGLWAQSTPPAPDDAAQLRQEIDTLKK